MSGSEMKNLEKGWDLYNEVIAKMKESKVTSFQIMVILCLLSIINMMAEVAYKCLGIKSQINALRKELKERDNYDNLT